MLPLRNPFRIWSLLYGSGVTIRNKMFDNGMLKSVAFDVPVIGVGNLRVGGTGKTPCVEWLLEHLQTQYKPAVLSRGYGRRTKGFRWVNVDDDARNCGDEPLQLKKKVFKYSDCRLRRPRAWNYTTAGRKRSEPCNT